VKGDTPALCFLLRVRERHAIGANPFVHQVQKSFSKGEKFIRRPEEVGRKKRKRRNGGKREGNGEYWSETKQRGLNVGPGKIEGLDRNSQLASRDKKNGGPLHLPHQEWWRGGA